MVAGIGVIAAGGISWVPSSPDFARYLPRTASAAAMVRSSIGGAGLVVLPMVLMGGVMAVGTPGLATASDPVSFLGQILPTWLAVPYLLIALVGMLLINSLSMYSAGFTAQTLGVKVSRAKAVSVNACISLVFGVLLMTGATSFFGSFISFLSLLAVAFSAWIGVFGADMLRNRRYDAEALMDTGRTSAYWYTGGFARSAMAAWGVGLVSGLLFTGSDWFTGPLGDSWVGRNGLGWAVTIVVSGLLYTVLPRAVSGAGAEAVEEESAGQDPARGLIGVK